MSNLKPGFSPEFMAATRHVIHDTRVNGQDGAITAVGVRRSDCIALLWEWVEDEESITAEAIDPLSALVHWAIATGVWIERARWQ